MLLSLSMELGTNVSLIRFTPRGIVALVFSVLSAFLGIAAISWHVSPSKPGCIMNSPCLWSNTIAGMACWNSGAPIQPRRKRSMRGRPAQQGHKTRRCSNHEICFDVLEVLSTKRAITAEHHAGWKIVCIVAMTRLPNITRPLQKAILLW